VRRSLTTGERILRPWGPFHLTPAKQHLSSTQGLNATQRDILHHMGDERGTVQRSFRLSRSTIDLLDAAATAGTESRNALADRLLGEVLRLERHPLIRFHAGAAGRRRPLVVGTRLYVHQVMATVRTARGDLEEAAAYLGVAPRLVRAAVQYYADFADEVDEDAAATERIERDERARWEREQRALS